MGLKLAHAYHVCLTGEEQVLNNSTRLSSIDGNLNGAPIILMTISTTYLNKVFKLGVVMDACCFR
jgi:hypothetical protein